MTSFGILDPQIANLTQRRALAREAATVQAQNKMLAVIKSLRAEFENPNNSITETITNQQLQWAKIVKTQWTDDGRCGVTLNLNKKEYQKLTGIKLTDR